MAKLKKRRGDKIEESQEEKIEIVPVVKEFFAATDEEIQIRRSQPLAELSIYKLILVENRGANKTVIMKGTYNECFQGLMNYQKKYGVNKKSQLAINKG